MEALAEALVLVGLAALVAACTVARRLAGMVGVPAVLVLAVCVFFRLVLVRVVAATRGVTVFRA